MGRMVDADELVGAAEIAERVGAKSANVIHVWRRRFPDFPEPVLRLEAGMIFVWPEVDRWFAEHRLIVRPAFDEPMMSVSEAAARLGVNRSAVYRWVRQGRLTATRPRPARIPAREVEALVERVRARPWAPFADE